MIVCTEPGCGWATDPATNEHAVYDAACHSYAADQGHHTVYQTPTQGDTPHVHR